MNQFETFWIQLLILPKLQLGVSGAAGVYNRFNGFSNGSGERSDVAPQTVETVPRSVANSTLS